MKHLVILVLENSLTRLCLDLGRDTSLSLIAILKTIIIMRVCCLLYYSTIY